MIVKGHCETLFFTWNGLETVLPVDRELEPDTSSGPFYFLEFFFFFFFLSPPVSLPLENLSFVRRDNEPAASSTSL